MTHPATLRDRFLSGSLTGSFHTQSNDWFPAPSPTGAGTGRTGSSPGSSQAGTTQPTTPITDPSKEHPMTEQQPMRLSIDRAPNTDILRVAIATEEGGRGAFIDIPVDQLRRLIDGEVGGEVEDAQLCQVPSAGVVTSSLGGPGTIPELLEQRDQALAELARVEAAARHPHKGPVDTDASMLREASKRIERGFPPGGSNTTTTVVRVLTAVADTLEGDA